MKTLIAAALRTQGRNVIDELTEAQGRRREREERGTNSASSKEERKEHQARDTGVETVPLLEDYRVSNAVDVREKLCTAVIKIGSEGLQERRRLTSLGRADHKGNSCRESPRAAWARRKA
jgi:hypothetical protein